MPFLDTISNQIDAALKAGSLNNDKMQPVKFYGLTTTIARKKEAAGAIEILPAVISSDGATALISPDSKFALQIYHKLFSNQYSYVKKSHGDAYEMKCSSELAMVVFVNTKLTGKTKTVLEPVLVFSIPQKLSPAVLADLKINTCLITPLSSNMDTMQVFKQEYPQADYFLNQQMDMFLIRYRVEITFNQACVDNCLCN